MLILALLGGSQAAVYSDSWLSTLFPTTVFLAYLAIHGENITVGRKFLPLFFSLCLAFEQKLPTHCDIFPMNS